MFQQIDNSNESSPAMAIVMTLLSLGSIVFYGLFANALYGEIRSRTPFKIHIYVGLLLALVGFGLSIRTLINARRASQGVGIAVVVFLFSLLVLITYLGLTALAVLG